MNFTRVIVAALIATACGMGPAGAQNLRSNTAAAPAEFPPASYQGKQYVDSNGCIFIRAGIDGNVTWVPRVTRGRQQVCGYQPTFAPGTAAVAETAPARAPEVVEITVPATAQPSARPAAPRPKPLPQAVAAPAAKPRVATPQPVAQAPAATVRRPSPAPAVASPRRQMPPAPIAPRAAAQRGGPCPNASPFSQQYINRGPGVRCGPQQEPPVTYGAGRDQQSVLAPYDPATRVVPRHVYDQRRNTQNVSIPEGYRPVWSDDRLNPHRAEQGLAPAAPRHVALVPEGYRPVVRDDDRLNPQRGQRTVAGDAQSDLIWTRTVPRQLVQAPTDRPVVTVAAGTLKSPVEATRAPVLRFSTRSAPDGTAQPVAGGRPRVTPSR